MSLIIPLLQDLQIPILDEKSFPEREAVLENIPAELHERIRIWLAEKYPHGLYSHQSQAIARAIQGENVCLATSTASGKSTVFQATACHLSLADKNALTVAVYPARALVQDQLGKWREIAEPLGLAVGQIDGSIPVKERQAVLERSSIVVMTPDVIHAWLLGRANEHSHQLQRIRLVILDEAHVYNGAFGSNAAYLFRRLAVASSSFQIIASTATIGAPEGFLEQLTGRTFSMFTKLDEGSRIPEKSVILTQISGKKSFKQLVDLLHKLTAAYSGRFLVFADSRRMIESLTRATLRQQAGESTQGGDEDTEEPGASIPGTLMPYRSGYEVEDRNAIQKALSNGNLKGVISTSALELGLDIGDIDLVVLLDTPPTIQAFWQRFGRAGRGRNPGQCLLIDGSGTVASCEGGLTGYLQLPPEPNYLYLGNRVIQFTQAMAAAIEITALGLNSHVWNQFTELPGSFLGMLENELNPSRLIDDDLFPLKQRAENGPHHEFPLRASGEPQYQILEQGSETPLGTLSQSQMVREAYPGAVYLYQARPYRIRELRLKNGLIFASKEWGKSTKPITQVMVFPNFSAWRQKQVHDDGFLVECDVQVSEQVTGFEEQKGSNRTQNMYGPKSPWAQKPANRFLRTSGVLWHFTELDKLSDTALEFIVEAFTRSHGIHRRDIGWGPFFANASPLGTGTCKGLCIYDDVAGGLRLTERLASSFAEVIDEAQNLARLAEEILAETQLQALMERVITFQANTSGSSVCSESNAAEGWIELIGANQPAILSAGTETIEVQVLKYFYSPTGLQYSLQSAQQGVSWRVPVNQISPIFGRTLMVRYNPETGEEIPAA